MNSELDQKSDQNSLQFVKPILVGLTGGTASGKTSLAKRVGERFQEDVAIISLDSFYKGLSEEDHENADNYNFDHPEALDFQLAFEKIKQLLRGQDCEIPCYDFALHKRTSEVQIVKTAPIILFEGIHGLLDSDLRDLMDLKIFVLTPDDIRLSRRIQRDIAERGRQVQDVLVQYCRFVKPAYDDFIKPTMKHADIIVPFTMYNNNAVNMVVQTLRIKLQIHKYQKEKKSLKLRLITSSEQEDIATNDIAKEDYYDQEKQEETMHEENIPFQDTLPFALVDISAEYGNFRGQINLYDSGSKQNFKIQTMINQLMTMFQQCFSHSKETKMLNQSYMFKLCLKKLIKKVCKLSQMSDAQKLGSSPPLGLSQSKQVGSGEADVIFIPELISKRSIQQLEESLKLSKGQKKVYILTLITCPKVISGLFKGDLDDQKIVFTLGFNDQFLNHDYLHNLTGADHFSFCKYLFQRMADKKKIKSILN